MQAWLDAAATRCPKCGTVYIDSAWYVIEIGSDIECGKCHLTFSTKKNAIDRILLRFVVKNETIQNLSIVEHLPVE